MRGSSVSLLLKKNLATYQYRGRQSEQSKLSAGG
jgi:hypothetical protein